MPETESIRGDDGAFKSTGLRRTKRVGPRGRNKPRVFLVGDDEVTLVGLGCVCDAVGISKKAFRGYEEVGAVPINRVIDEKGRRWYHPKFVEFLVPLLEGQSERRDPLWKLKARVEQAWAVALEAGNVPLLTTEQESL